jgi:hypothetical protein
MSGIGIIGNGRLLEFGKGPAGQSVEALVQSAYQQGMQHGMQNVRYIRCEKHQAVPQRHSMTSAGPKGELVHGPECAICLQEQSLAMLEKVRQDVMRVAQWTLEQLAPAKRRLPNGQVEPLSEEDAAAKIAAARLTTAFTPGPEEPIAQ